MSEFQEKLRKNLLPTDQDWENHLIAAHAKEPRMTPEAFAAFTTDDGKNSYEILAEHAGVNDHMIVDLACGDGHLIPYLLKRTNANIVGVDISPEGLEIAKVHLQDSRVSFHLARAQDLPFPDKSIDTILCHMAFMLMSPVEPVVKEVNRVLKPGGVFAAMFSAGTRTGFYAELQKIIGIFMRTHLPRYSEARSGSNNVSSGETMSALFKGPVEESNYQLRYHVPPAGVWSYLENMYFVPVMPDHAQRELKAEVLSLARDHADSEGKILFFVPMKCCSIRAP